MLVLGDGRVCEGNGGFYFLLKIVKNKLGVFSIVFDLGEVRV